MKLRQYIEIFSNRFVQKMLLDYIGIGISAINDKFDLW